MKAVFVLTLCALAVSAIPIEQHDAEHINGENGWYVPQLDGSLQWMDKDAAEKMLTKLELKESRESRLTTTPVKFYLYTQSNPDEPQQFTEKTVSNTNFDGSNPTRIVIHGWSQSYSSPMNEEISDAWLSHGDYNIIVVDWGRARSVEYASSVLAIPAVGKKVAKMIDFLVENFDMSLDTLHIIGHSLGAHVSGLAAKHMESGTVNTIVGLDTALPLFSYDNLAKRLTDTDAEYVETIHTCGGMLGFLRPIGKGSFYPNGGKAQPGCGMDLTGSCAHSRSVTYYVEAVEADNFPSIKCGDYEDAVKKTCGSAYSSVRMAAKVNAFMVSGEFYVPVRSEAPFGMAE